MKSRHLKEDKYRKRAKPAPNNPKTALNPGCRWALLWNMLTHYATGSLRWPGPWRNLFLYKILAVCKVTLLFLRNQFLSRIMQWVCINVSLRQGSWNFCRMVGNWEDSIVRKYFLSATPSRWPYLRRLSWMKAHERKACTTTAKAVFFWRSMMYIPWRGSDVCCIQRWKHRRNFCTIASPKMSETTRSETISCLNATWIISGKFWPACISSGVPDNCLAQQPGPL